MRCLQFDNDACINLHNAKKTTESQGNKIKDFESFDIMFFIHLAKQNVGVLG